MDLELLVDMPAGHISRIENGQINPTKETLIKLGFALGLSYEETVELLIGLTKNKDLKLTQSST